MRSDWGSVAHEGDRLGSTGTCGDAVDSFAMPDPYAAVSRGTGPVAPSRKNPESRRRSSMRQTRSAECRLPQVNCTQ